MTTDRPTNTLDETIVEPTPIQTETAAASEPSVAEKAREIGFKGADRGRELTADGLEKLSQTMQRISGENEQQQPAAADIASTVAAQTERAATYLRSTDARTMAGKLEQVARRSPLLVIGGVVVLGALASRIFRGGSKS